MGPRVETDCIPVGDPKAYPNSVLLSSVKKDVDGYSAKVEHGLRTCYVPCVSWYPKPSCGIVPDFPGCIEEWCSEW